MWNEPLKMVGICNNTDLGHSTGLLNKFKRGRRALVKTSKQATVLTTILDMICNLI
jgi:hypothetical protein